MGCAHKGDCQDTGTCVAVSAFVHLISLYENYFDANCLSISWLQDTAANVTSMSLSHDRSVISVTAGYEVEMWDADSLEKIKSECKKYYET